MGDFWLNETYIGFHEGGFTPFAFDVSRVLTAGENTIVVRIDNPPWTTRLDTVPAVNNDFFNYTGIVQNIYLEMVPNVQVARLDIVPLSSTGDVKLTYVIENRTDEEKQVVLTPFVHDTDFVQRTGWRILLLKAFAQIRLV
ncbi:beta-galactosidase [Bacillus sp. JCM 19046]|nr:beta-galactosidase [Bacillus sp. JCM 19046]